MFSHKRKEILIYAAVCTNLEDFILCEIRQPQKDPEQFHLYEVCGVVKLTETDLTAGGGCQGLGEREMES
jgi:hypothetical protein